jgi:hypothetical protein
LNVPIHVHIPIHLRADADSLGLHGDLVDGALGRALGRAVARSRSEVLDRTGGFLGVQFDPPRVRWSGAGLNSLSAATRQATEQRITALIDAASLELVDDIHAASPLSEAPVERLDRDRRRLLGRYAVDSYQGGTTALPVETDEPTWVTAWDISGVPEHIDVREVRANWLTELSLRNLSIEPGISALIVQTFAGWVVFYSPDAFATQDTMLAFNFGPQKRRQPVRTGKGITFRDVVLTPSPTPSMMTEIVLPAPAERLDTLRDLWANEIRKDIRDAIDPGEEADEHLLTEAELTQLIEGAVEQELAARATELGTSAVLVRLDWGDIHFNVGLPKALGLTGPVRVMPMTYMERSEGPLFGTGEVGEGGGAGGRAKGGGEPGTGSQYGISGPGAGEGEDAKHLFPHYGGADEMVCEPFLDAEPDPEKLGSAHESLQRLVNEIATRLEIPPCEYAATFCAYAAAQLEGLAYAIGKMANSDTRGVLSKPVGGTRGTLGQVSFMPVASPALQLLRRLSQAALKIAELRREVADVYLHGAGSLLLGDRYTHNQAAFVRQFHEAVSPGMKAGVGAIFSQTCQVLMLQLLGTSADQIAARQRNLKAYAPIFQDVMVRRLSDLGKLTRMRDRLRMVEVARSTQGVLPAGVPGLDWVTAARGLADACVATEGFAHLPVGAENDIVWEGDTAKIRDERGFLWTRQALEETIASTRGQAESMDPLIQQLSDIPDTIEKFRADPTAAERILGDLLADMKRLNDEKQMEARFDPKFGLRTGRIQESSQGTDVPGYKLSGIHQLAHEQIAEFFRGDSAYAEGIDHAFSVELGLQGLEHAFTFIGLAFLAVVCPPAAFVVGVELAAIEVVKAESRADLYRALIDPELVLNRAEIEMERYIAYVGLALSLLPEATTAVRAASIGLRGAAKKGLTTGLRIAGRSIIRQMSRQATEALLKASMERLLLELATNAIMELVIPSVVGPVIEAVEREIAVHTSVGGKKGALELIDAIEREAAKRQAAPLPDPVLAGMGLE